MVKNTRAQYFTRYVTFQNKTKHNTDPNAAMAVGPPVNDITAPPTTGGLGMIPTGLAQVGRRATQQVNAAGESGMVTMGDNSYSHETTFSTSGGGISNSREGEGNKSGGWWPFGGGSS